MPSIDNRLKNEEYQRQMKLDYERVFSTDEGKRVLEDMKKSSSFYKTSFDQDARVSAYLEGARAFVLNVVIMSEPAPDEQNKGVAITGGDNG